MSIEEAGCRPPSVMIMVTRIDDCRMKGFQVAGMNGPKVWSWYD